MSFYPLVTLTAGIFHLILTAFVLSRDLRSDLNRTYFLWGAALTLWNLSCFFKYEAALANDEITGKFLTQLVHLAVVLLPVSNLHLCMLIIRISRPALIRWLYFLSICFAVSVFTPFYMTGVRPTPFGYYAEPGPAFWGFMVLYQFISVGTIILVYACQRGTSPLQRSRLRSLQWAQTILFLAGTHDLLQVSFHWENYPLINLPALPLGNLAAIFYGIILAYSVLQHQLLNIHLALSRFAAQLVRISFIFFAGFLSLLTVKLLVPKAWFPAFAFFSALGVLLVTALLASILFPKLFGKGEEKLERRILGDRFEYQDKVRGFIQTIPSYAQTDVLLQELHDLLVKTVRLNSYHLLLLNETGREFSLFRTYPISAAGPGASMSLDAPIVHLLRKGDVDYFSCRSDHALLGENALERAARRQLQALDPDLCFPFYVGGDLFGFLLIGGKATREPYTPTDIQLFAELVRNLGYVLSQIRLKSKVLLAEQMELLGTMSRGMAHDLNNLITPIWTYLQMAAADVKDPELTEELLPEAIRNLETIRSYVKESLFFSRTQSLQLSQFQLDRAVRGAIELAQPQLKRKGLSAMTQVPPDTVVEMDEVLIQRLIGNLLSNAIDASPANGQIDVCVQRLGKTESERDWLRLLVIDHGEGISSENLKRVATPYFTTKDRGTKTRGFGLGLAICRKIVHLHGGHFSITSEPKKGTTVQVDLPNRPDHRSRSVTPVASS